MSKGVFHLAVATGFALLLIGSSGCSEKKIAPAELSPEQLEEARQQHIEYTQRELSEK
ncbi:MAG: hypothetical protein L0Z53_10960 [Acidobacteriales bacterium]|nr:hypothetical protein [Terriglobales bacterium]